MAKYERHIFICTHERDADDERGSCTASGSAGVADAFKRILHEKKLKRAFRANPTGCLGQCGLGATVVVYPDAVWYGGVTAEDVPEIIEKHLLGGEVVERLRIPDEKLKGKARTL